MKRLLLALPLATTLLLGGCDDSSDEPRDPAQVAVDLGQSRYKGVFPIPTPEILSNGDKGWTFDSANRGPICIEGASFSATTRDVGSNTLLIFLQGGGACWSDFCLAVRSAAPGMPSGGLLDADAEDNPFSGFNVLYLPYCDGSLFVGDNDRTLSINGEDVEVTQRGLQNLTASLDVAIQEFGDRTDRVILAGASGGAFGTIFSAPLVRHYFPDAELVVVNDAGMGVAKAGEPEFVDTLVDEFDARDFVPDDCENCLQDGHVTDLIRWYMEIDQEVTFSAISSWRDYIISETFLQVGSEAFANSLRSELDALHAEFPDRYRRFIYPGNAHTALIEGPEGILGSGFDVILPPLSNLNLGNVNIGTMDATSNGVVLRDWLDALFNGTDVWQDNVSPFPTDFDDE